jgi:hypothetical protein
LISSRLGVSAATTTGAGAALGELRLETPELAELGEAEAEETGLSEAGLVEAILAETDVSVTGATGCAIALNWTSGIFG